MLRRIQSVWLLLAAACGFVMAQLPVFEATLANGIIQKINPAGSLLLFALIIGIACLAAVVVFLYKNRSLQFKLSVAAIVLAVAAIVIQVAQVENYKTANTITKGTYQWGALLPIAMVIFLFLAARAIYKDEKLIKSLDRLR
ncbi:MAG: hypothetical protein RLZZ316_2600 [Bacteroidota bacterium]|jgi:D-alanyl-lipoteichoic acid acyltransferase DltB (MBOAT superfamily)